MITELAINVNDVTFVLPETMYIDIRPETALTPVQHQRADEQPALTYLAGLSRGSQHTQWSALVLIAAVLTNGACTPLTLPWVELRRQHVIAMRAWLVEHRKPATGQRIMAALRATIKECWRLDLITAEQYMKAVDVPAIRGASPDAAAGRALSHGEKAAMLTACAEDTGAAGVRNAAIFCLAVYGGLRRAEIANLRLEDYSAEDGKISVFGKNSDRRVVYVADGVVDALADWLHLRGGHDGPLFLHINRGGNIQPVGISDDAIYGIMQRVAKRAGVKRFSPHDLRRTYAGDMLDAGVDVVTVQKLMGHKDTKTTGKYDRRGERTKREGAQRLHVPYRRRFA